MVEMQRTESQTGRGHEEPFGVQFSVFLPNRVGALRTLLERLAEGDVQIHGLSIVNSSEWSVVRAVCSNPNRARALLAEHHSGFIEKQVLLVELAGQDSLTEVCALLLRAELNILFAYPLLIQSRHHAVMVIDVDDREPAVSLLARHGYVLLGAEDLAEPS